MNSPNGSTTRSSLRPSRRDVLLGMGGASLSLAGCIGDLSESDDNPGTYRIYATMPALWDFVRQVAGEQMEVIDLVPVGEHGHEWNPEPGTVEQLENADGFVYLREFSSWQDAAADQLAAEDIVVIEASEGIEFFDSPAEENDEHWWMDPVECKNGVSNIASGLASIDPENTDVYESNADAFNEELDTLHEEFSDIVEAGRLNELVVGTHDSFQWWHRRYGLDIYSPVGTSPDDAASPQDVEAIESLMEEFDIGHVLYDIGESGRLARNLAEETGAEILPLSPVETQIDGRPELDTGLVMESDWGYLDHFREINLPSVETALQSE